MFELVVIAACLFLNAFLAGTEMAFVTVGKPRLRQMARSGNKEAARILTLRENPERTLSVIQVGITLVGAIAAAVGGAGSEEMLEPLLRTRLGLGEGTAEFISIMLVVIPLTYLNVVIGELVPKALALRNPVKIVLRSTRWLILFDKILSPIVTALEWSTKKLLKTFFQKSKPEPTGPVDTVELDQLSGQAREYVLNIVGVEKRKIKDILIPWDQVVAVKVDFSPEEVETIALASGHTRLPVLEDGHIVGILNTKEFMALRKSGDTNWQKIVRSPVLVQENDSLLRAFRQMQEKRSHLSIVLKGSLPVGIVTMEDILEEVMGDIYDEDDDGKIKRILSTSAALRNIGTRA